MTPNIEEFPIILEVDVAWGEMDAFAHINNAAYFRYFESARIAFLLAIGLVDLAANDGIGPILASTSCVFRRPLTFPDRIRVGARASEVSDDRFTMEYIVVSNALDAVAATGTGVVVAYDYNRGAKASIPSAVRARMDSLC
ncbi:MAG: thioesterase family protein [Longimicrobiales bacterium]